MTVRLSHVFPLFRLLLVVWLLLLGGSGCSENPPVELFDVTEKSIEELQVAMETGAVTSEKLVEMYLARIEAYDQRGPVINSIIVLNPEAAETARALDEERQVSGTRSPLHGIPVLIKDNYDMAGLPTTNGSIAMASVRPPDDAFQVRRLREAGAVILGKTNLHEFARGITTVSSLGGQTRNPYDTLRNPGGSSGGTGAAIAASFSAAGMGSDTCGSIRIPSMHNNLVGLRGTEGLSSRDGIVPLSHTQDIAGPLTRTVTDLAVMLDATVGTDPADLTTLDADSQIPPTYTSSLNADGLDGARLGLLTTLVAQESEDQTVADVIASAVIDLERLGATVVEVDIDGLSDLLDTYVVLSHEFKFDLEAYLGAIPDSPVSSLTQILADQLHHPSVRERLEQSNAVESLDTDEYLEALSRREVLRLAVFTAMDEFEIDALIYPTLRQQAARIGERQGGDNCRLSAQSGLPAITVPAGFTSDDMPVGLEMLSRRFTEPKLIEFAYSFEQGTKHRRPPSSTPPLP